MFKHKSLLTLFLLPSIFLSLQCKRPDCSKDVPLEIMIPQEVLNYVDFKAGSYWIYQDSATGEIDSEMVISSKHTMEDHYATNKCGDVSVTRKYENINMVINRYDSLGNLKVSLLREFDNSIKKSRPSEANIFFIDIYNSFLIGYPFDRTYYTTDYECTESTFDTLIVDNIKYYNSLKVTRVFMADRSSYSILIFAKNLGLIKFTNIYSGKTIQNTKLIRKKIT